jgi:hypothetical protein
VGRVLSAALPICARFRNKRPLPLPVRLWPDGFNLGLRAKHKAAAEVAAARQALQAQPDLLPGQALAAAGQVRPTAQALLQRTSAQAPERTMNMLNAQDTVRLNQLAAIAGGTDQTAARAAREESRQILNKLMIPQLKIELGAANIAGQQLPRLQGQATQFGDVAGQKVEDVRRFTAAGERARGAQVTPVPGMPRVSSQLLTLMTWHKPQMKWLTKRREGQLSLVTLAGLHKPQPTALKLTVLNPCKLNRSLARSTTDCVT